MEMDLATFLTPPRGLEQAAGKREDHNLTKVDAGGSAAASQPNMVTTSRCGGGEMTTTIIFDA